VDEVGVVEVLVPGEAVLGGRAVVAARVQLVAAEGPISPARLAETVMKELVA